MVQDTACPGLTSNGHTNHQSSDITMLYLVLALLAIFSMSICNAAQHLQLTALLSHPNGTAYFECWQIAKPFSEYPTVGSAISGLADVSNISYVVLPPLSNEGFHTPPHPMSVNSNSLQNVGGR